MNKPTIADLYNLPLADFPKVFANLPEPDWPILPVNFQSEITGPRWYRQLAPTYLGLIGMRNWQGTLFLPGNQGINVIQKKGVDRQVLPFDLRLEPSSLDGKLAAVAHYLQNSRRPWPDVTNEMRWLDARCLLGMIIFKEGLLNRWAFPFLLRKQTIYRHE